MSTKHLNDGTLHGALKQKILQYSNRPFLFFEDDVFGYEDIDAESNRIGAALQQIGIEKGDSAAIILGNRPEHIFIWFGLSCIGAVAVQIDTAFSAELLVSTLDRTDCRVAFVEHDLLAPLVDFLPELPKIESIVVVGGTNRIPGDKSIAYEEFLKGAGQFQPIEVDGADPATILFSSGRTKPYKGCILPHNFAVFMGEKVSVLGRYTEHDRLLSALPLSAGNAQYLSVTPALISGAQLVLLRHFSAQTFWDSARRYGCTEFNYIGGMINSLLGAQPLPDDSDNPIRMMFGGGAPRDRFEEFEERFEVRLIEAYGMHEIGIPLSNTYGRRKLGSCGKPVSDYELSLVDDSGNEVGPNTPGELCVRLRKHNVMMLGYYGMTETTVGAWRDLWFHTGDYLMYDDDGWFYFIDRIVDSLRRDDKVISSFDIERVVNAHETVLECAAVSLSSQLGKDDVMLCVILKPRHSPSPEELIAHCEARLTKNMVPRYVRFLEALPKIPANHLKGRSASVQKALLRGQGVTADTYDRDAGRA